MADGMVVSLGMPPVEGLTLDSLALEFGWSFEIAGDLEQLQKLGSSRSLVAILFDAHGLGLSWEQALRLIGAAAAPALLIPCHRFSDVVNWRDLADAGAFHALALPLSPSEVRQSLGFVWSARMRRLANVLPIRTERREGQDEFLRADSCQCADSRCLCSDRLKPSALKASAEFVA